MGKSSEWAILVRAEEQAQQELAEREQEYFNAAYSKGRTETKTGETAHKKKDK